MQNEIKTIAVISAAEKGCLLAEALLRTGYRIVLEDAMEARLHEAAGRLATLGIGADERLLLAHTPEEALRQADLVIETVADEIEMKLELFSIFDRFAKPNAVLATTSESISIADLAEMTVCPERCIGLRWRAGVAPEFLVGPTTSQETLAACEEVGRRMGQCAGRCGPRSR